MSDYKEELKELINQFGRSRFSEGVCYALNEENKEKKRIIEKNMQRKEIFTLIDNMDKENLELQFLLGYLCDMNNYSGEEDVTTETQSQLIKKSIKYYIESPEQT